MFEVKGKFNTAKIFTDNVDNETISQVMNILNQESLENTKIRIMPDCHAGSGCVIGTTMTIRDKIIPNLVGVDIGCGMYALKLDESEIDYSLLDQVINENIPSGAMINEKQKGCSRTEMIKAPINHNKAQLSIGSLGGGNHFIEVDRDEEDNLWVVIHTGSRHLGIEVCNYYQDKAWEELTKNPRKRNAIIEELKSKGMEHKIESALKELSMQSSGIPKPLAYVEGYLFDDYIYDMSLTQEHAKINREAIAEQIIKKMNLHVVEDFHTIHNYIDVKNMILRKGAISAQAEEKMIIPMNMRDGSLICLGKGNLDWNFSAPHGAGRLMSRSKAKEQINMDDFRKSMEGIYSTSVDQSTIDESPFAYKPMEEIMENIQDTATILSVVKPEYNFKASEMRKELIIEKEETDYLDL